MNLIDLVAQTSIAYIDRIKEPAFAGSKHLQMFALSLVHERGELFKL